MEYRITRSDEYLEHFGIKGQKHGLRRYQNQDGSLTAEGREHYGVGDGTGSSSSAQTKQSFVSRHKKGLAIAGGVLAAGLAAYGISRLVNNKSVQKGSEASKKILEQHKLTLNVPRTDVPRVAVPRTETPKVNVKQIQRDSRKFQKRAAYDIAKKQQLALDLDRMQNDILKRYGYR